MAGWDTQYTMTGGPTLTGLSVGRPTSPDTTDLVLSGGDIDHVSLGLPCLSVQVSGPIGQPTRGLVPTFPLSLQGPVPDIIGTVHPVLFLGNFAIPVIKWFKMRAKDASRPSNDPYITWKSQYSPDFTGEEAPLPHGSLTGIAIADTWDQLTESA